MNPLPHEHKSPLSITLLIGGGLFLVFGCLLLFTNPSQKKYELFAAEQLVIYAKENVCQATSGNLEEAIKSQVCNLMIDTGKNQIPTLIGKTTQKRNYLLLSIYETNLYLYNFTTIGLLNQFYVIGFEKVYDQ
ncbi:DUF4359 domain-containing protein [Geminocystis sp. NIES-3709]|uniref:DUF4359 domain-containing protein n=1 Tax=Geminocystis sp. NIES-3709 TaxID=1617448 RepID=UPI0005FCCE91|nr:DUF4359 domain-containing protein [Geminocystis sp. NIES-3709]BAQ65861.1 hypothetical protein GM3709_2626 [Geminocystis sp. NIES-3709]